MESKEHYSGAKYMEGYLERKESKWVICWAVLRGSQLTFFKDVNAHVKKDIIEQVDIGCQCSFSNGKNSKGNKFDLDLKTGSGKKYFLRATSEVLRLQWLYALGLAAKGKPSTEFLAEAGLEFDNQTRESEIDSPVSEQKTVNQYSEVPNFSIPMGSNVASGMSDQDMQKDIAMKKPHTPSFGAHCKRILWKKGKSQSADTGTSPRGCRSESEGAELPEPFYDDVPQDKPPWYLGKISREEAQNLLQFSSNGTFLVRDSESNAKPGAFTLTLRAGPGYRHHKIDTLHDGQLVIRQHEDKPFPNLAMLMKNFAASQAKENFRLTPYVDGNAHPLLEKRSSAPVHGYENLPPKHGDSLSTNSTSPRRPAGYEDFDTRPPVPGCEKEEDDSFSEHLPRVPKLPSRSPGEAAAPRHSYENLPDKKKAPPPLTKRNTAPVLQVPGYENLPSRDKPPLDRKASQPILRGYENVPAKDHPPLPPDRVPHGYENLPSKPHTLPPKAHTLPSGAPPLPPRQPQAMGYENLPRNPRSPTGNLPSYQNMPPRAPPRSMQRAATMPAHIMEQSLGHGSH